MAARRKKAVKRVAKKVAKVPKEVVPLNPVTHTELTLVCPFAIFLPRVTMKDKRITINLNNYRNWNFRLSNEVKKAYKDHMAEQLVGVGIQTPVEVEIRVYKPTRRLLDKDNVISVTKKFLFDAMTEYGCWPDDNDDYVKTEISYPTVHDKESPRVEVTFKTIKED